MKLSQLDGIEVINMHDGTRIGTISATDLVIDVENGRIKAVVVPNRTRFSLFSSRNELTIPWERIRKIGSEVMIVDLSDDPEYKSKKGKPFFFKGDRDLDF